MATLRLAIAFFGLASAAQGQPAPPGPLADQEVLQARLAVFFLKPQEAINRLREELASNPDKDHFAKLSQCVTAYAGNEGLSARHAAEIADQVDKELCAKHPSSCISHSRQESLTQTFAGSLIGVLGAELGGQPKADTSKEFKAHAQEMESTWSVARMARPELLPIMEQVYFNASGTLAGTILQTCVIPAKEKPAARGHGWIWPGVAASVLLLAAALWGLMIMRKRAGR